MHADPIVNGLNSAVADLVAWAFACGLQIDQNLMVMTIIDEIAAEHGLAALFNEKPFAGVNGSGKHNNWSLGTDSGVNLFNPTQVHVLHRATRSCVRLIAHDGAQADFVALIFSSPKPPARLKSSPSSWLR